MQSTMQTVVIKLGGGRGIDPHPVCDDIASLVQDGVRIILVHGGSHETNEMSERLGHPPEFITSPSGHTSRRTDRRTLDIFQMVYCGRVNKGIVERLQSLGVDAVGLSGIDGRLWSGERKTAIRALEPDGRTRIIRDDLSGRVTAVNTSLLDLLFDAGHTPVLTPPAIAMTGEAINVDADRAAAMTAAAMRADALVLLSNIPGLLRDPADPGSLIRRVEPSAPQQAREAAVGRMKNKVLGAEEAIAGGVGRVVIADAGVASPVRAALAGEGTLFESVPA